MVQAVSAYGTWQVRVGIGSKGQMEQGARNRALDQLKEGDQGGIAYGLICCTPAKKFGPH